jgi:transposase
MRRFVEGTDRSQATLLPECLEDWICENNPVRAVDVFVEGTRSAELGFGGLDPEATGRPLYHPSVLLKLYIYGYLNRVQSSRRLEREAGRDIEVMWLTGRLVPDHKTIADFRRDNGPAIRKVCAQFVALFRAMGLLTTASVAIDGSKFKAANNRDKNFTRAKMERRLAQIEESVARYLSQLDTADLQEPSEALATKTAHLKEKLAKLADELQRLKALEKERGGRQRRRSREPDYPRKSNLPGIQATACSARDPHPQRSPSSHSPANHNRENRTTRRFHTARVKSPHYRAAAWLSASPQ